ncbi:hypothetical protein SDC9_203724 [bioreactor metagenome]|uniref:Uncharacterized protein n=1 Tax=bioreactor metagenome TaxID=1076179 RepID=A0A645IX99_9ZZZZ
MLNDDGNFTDDVGELLNGGGLLPGVLEQRLRPGGNLTCAPVQLSGGSTDAGKQLGKPVADGIYGVKQCLVVALIFFRAAAFDQQVAPGHITEHTGRILKDRGRIVSVFARPTALCRQSL